jgi:glycine betaine catabolism A
MLAKSGNVIFFLEAMGMTSSPPARPSRSSDGARSLPRAFYHDETLFEEEYHRIFQNAWWMVGRESDWKHPNEFHTFDLAGQPIVVIRRNSATLAAFHNVCRHRGAMLICQDHGSLEHAAITCPYHAWTYHLDGGLAGAPNMLDSAGFQREEWGLKAVGIELIDRFVLVNLAGVSAAIPPALTRLYSAWKPWGLDALIRVGSLQYEVAANWKLLFQNYSECYHCPTVHPALNRLTPYLDSENIVSEGPYLGGPMTLADSAITMSLDGRGIARALPGLDELQRRQVHYYTVFPGYFVSLHPDYVLVHRLNPRRVDRTQVICDFLCHPSVGEDPTFDPYPAIEFWDQTNQQDWEVCERVQLGARSRDFAPGPYSNLESTVAAFDRYYRQEMGR